MTDITNVATPAPTRYFEYLPAGFFGSVMGLTGLSLTWRQLHMHHHAPAWIADALAVIAVVAFVLLAAAYAMKVVTATDAVRAEFNHPIAVNMFGTVWVSLLLLPIVLAPFSLLLARVLWVIGAAGMITFAWYVVSRWMTKQYERPHAAPAWIIPVVGLLDVPLALPALGWTHLHSLMVVGLALGLFFAMPLFTMIFIRLIFDTPLPQPLQPTLLILVAPTAVGVSAYQVTTGELDLFAKALFAVSLFLLAVMLGRLRHLPSCCPFKVGWWATSFPLAASAVAALRFAEAEPGWATDAIALALSALASVVIVWLLGRTVWGIARGELRQLSS